jgi:ankyrin repeat protein
LTNITTYNLQNVALNYAVWKHDEDALITLLKEYDINTRDNCHYTPLLASAQYNSIKCCNILIQKNANTNLFERNGFTPLMIASYFGYIEIVKLLLSTNLINLEIKDFCGRSALTWAIIGNHLEVKEYLLRKYFYMKEDFSNSPCDYESPQLSLTNFQHGAEEDIKDGNNYDSRTPVPSHVTNSSNEAILNCNSPVAAGSVRLESKIILEHHLNGKKKWCFQMLFYLQQNIQKIIDGKSQGEVQNAIKSLLQYTNDEESISLYKEKEVTSATLKVLEKYNNCDILQKAGLKLIRKLIPYGTQND